MPEPPNSTIIETIARHARAQPDKPAFIFLPDGEAEGERLSFGALERLMNAVAAELRSRDLAGERVVLVFSSGFEFIATFFGCLAAGVIAVPACPPRRAVGVEHIAKIAEHAQARLVLIDRATKTTLDTLTQDVPLDRLWPQAPPLEAWDLAGLECADPAELPDPNPQDIAFLQYTSGSTGDPKGVIVSHANLMANQRAIKAGFDHSADTVVVSWLPFHHDMGLVGMVMQPVFLGRPCVLMPPEAFIQRPIRWLKAIARYGATTSGGPNFGYERCLTGISDAALERAGPLDLQRWRVAFTGAEPIRARSMEAFARKFAPIGLRPTSLYPCYGLAEATLMVTGVAQGEPLRVETVETAALGGGVSRPTTDKGTQLVQCGRSWGPDRVVIVDPRTRAPVPEGRVGEIWVTGPSAAQGYWRRDELTDEVFRAERADRPGTPHLRTGDLGYWRDGLFVVGRIKDLVILNGRNYYPQDIEASVRGLHPAFGPQAAVFETGDLGAPEVVLVQEVRPRQAAELDGPEIEALIRRKIGADHELRLTEVFLTTSRLPLTTSGKIRRRACCEAWRAGRLQPLPTAPSRAQAPAKGSAHVL